MQARLQWIKTARPAQLTPPLKSESSTAREWRIWLILAGRGWGKTRTGAEDIAHYALWHDGVRIAIVAPTMADARDTCMEGESGLLQLLPASCVKAWRKSHGILYLTNGSRIKLFSAEQPERLRGPQHHRAWCDEMGAWVRPETFDHLLFGLRLGDNPQIIITTTPRPTPLLRNLIARADDDVWLTHGRTVDNQAHLPAAMLTELLARYQGTRLGRQELDAEMLEDNGGSLWSATVLQDVVQSAPTMRRVIVAIDPALQGRADSDETGIIAAGLGVDDRYYVLADESGRYASDIWAAKAAKLAETMRADSIYIEVNAGGSLLTRILQHYAPQIKCVPVHAVHNKWDRAIPIAALYEQGRVSHAKVFPELMAQMAGFTMARIAHHSPDRVDALVWAITALLERPVNPTPQIRSLHL